MAKNYVGEGRTVTLPSAPYARSSGQGVLAGALFGICTTDVALGGSVEIAVMGVFDVAKNTSQAVAVGDRLYWDDAGKRLTTTVGSNFHVGIAVAVALAADATARVHLGLRVPAAGA